MESFQDFTGAITDKQIKDRVVEIIAHQIYETKETGLLPQEKSDNNDNHFSLQKIIEQANPTKM